MDTNRIRLEPGWKTALIGEFEKPYMRELRDFLKNEIQKRKLIYPPSKDIFSAFNHTPLDEVKVVVLGQDPYHGPGQAHGLCFSVRPGVAVPPSLINIYKELASDLGVKPVSHGCLVPWAKQGVLLLNATLSVEHGKAGSHQNRGWENFTDTAIHYLAEKGEHIVFMLWGSFAQKKGSFIDRKKHLILTAPHPSPLSAHRGFLGCKHFSQANNYLIQKGKTPIDWQLPEQMENAE